MGNAKPGRGLHELGQERVSGQDPEAFGVVPTLEDLLEGYSEVVVEFDTTRKEGRQAVAAMESEKYPHYPRWLMKGFIPVVVILGGFFLVSDLLAGRVEEHLDLLGLVVLGLLGGLITRIVYHFRGRNPWHRRVVISAEGVSEEAGFSSPTPWSRITKVFETPEFFLFSKGFARSMQSIPKRVLSATEIERVRAIILEHVWEPDRVRLLHPGSADWDRR